MPASPAKIRRFQVAFLKFIDEKKIQDVHIYHHVMNYWSNDRSEVSLQEIKEAITSLCNEKLILSKNNAHLSIGASGVPEEDQKNNAVCTILEAGRKYVKMAELKKTIMNALILLLIAAALYSMWHYRKVLSYFFR